MDYYKQKTDIFILGEQTYIEYNSGGTKNEQISHKEFVDNNILYTVSANENDVQLKELYAFTKGEEYEIYKFENNIIHINKTILSRPVNSKYYTNIITSKIYFDLNKLEVLDKDDHAYVDKIIVAEYGNLIYYFITKEVHNWVSYEEAYYLYRLDTSNNEEGLLAYFKESSGNGGCPKFDKYFTDNDAHNLDIIVRNS